MTAIDVRNALLKRFSDGRQYAIAEEVGLTTGGGCRRLDMLVMDCYCSNGFRIDGFEIKVSSSDLRRELSDPDKHCVFFDVLDFFTLACPAEVVNPLIDSIPQKWGIMIINEDGSTRYKRRPLALRDEKTVNPVPRGFFASVVRAIQSRTPSEEELKKEYEKGFEKGKKEQDYMTHYQMERVKRDYEKIRKYDDLECRLRLWRDDPEVALAEFEEFRNLRTDQLHSQAENLIESLQRFNRLLDVKTEEKTEDAE